MRLVNDMNRALSMLATGIADALTRFAESIDPKPKATVTSRDRDTRHERILNEIVQAGGVVTYHEWRGIAARHGYDGRGTAGFFNGLLNKLPDGSVAITEGGRARAARLAANPALDKTGKLGV